MLTRRHMLKTLVVSAGSLSAASLLSACHDNGRDSLIPVDSAAVFPQSVASGDPRANSVVLWTRVEHSGSDDLSVGVEVATDDGFTNLVVGEYLTALAAHDHCLKVRVIGLQADTVYYYRFTYGRATTNTGRTRTAPAASSDATVKFAFLSCQDYIGRFYNTYLMLLEQDPHFVVFLGDYIYETTGDDQFQGDPGARSIEFDDLDGALRVGPDDDFFYAAASLDNYRQLYKTYRQDALLQQVHERYAFINTWDDHEYSDDCWGENASYYDGAVTEVNRSRRQLAEQAFFEFTPIDQYSVADTQVNSMGALTVSDDQLYPETRIYREFRFGRHLHLFMTDFRTYRPDHLIAEDAFPGTVVFDQPQLETYFTSQSEDFADVSAKYSPYVNIDDVAYAAQKTALVTALTTAYEAALTNKGIDPATQSARVATLVSVATTGNVAASVINSYVSEDLKFSDVEMDAMSRGLAYSTLGKSSLFSDVGARYFVVKDIYDIYAAMKAEDEGEPNILGDTQMQWLTDGLQGSTATWKVVGTSVSFSPLILDLSEPPLDFISAFYGAVPADFKKSFYFNVDHWDGFPVQKRALLEGVLGQSGAITISGDVHSSYVTQHPETITGLRSFDFTGAAVSSGTWGEFTKTAAESINPALVYLVPLLDDALVQATTRDSITSKMQFASTKEHGVSIMTVSGDSTRVDFHLVASSETVDGADVSVVSTNYYESSATYLAKRRTVSYQVVDGVLSSL